MTEAERGAAVAPRRRWSWIIVGVMALVAVVAAIGVPLLGAQVLLTPHHGMTTAAGEVIAITHSEITLTKTAAGQRIGTYGLHWDTGAGPQTGTAIVGPVSATTDDSVTRPISQVRGELPVGTAVVLDPNVWNTDPETALGIAFTEVDIEGQLGAMPAWQVPGDDSTWVLFVHGIDGLRQSALRPLPQIVDAGLPALVITYRNDAGAPSSPNGLISLGETEWKDLESAAAYAIDQGAEHFVLYGDSMGGSIVTQFMHRSQYADRVVGMVLDAPVLNWAGVLQNQADRLHFGAFGGLVQLAVQWRGGIDLGVLDELDQTEPFQQLPILLFQGLADPLVPHAESEQFADSVSDAQYVPVPGAGHIQSWNVDPASYEAKLAAFLAQFGG
ncbi:MAG TPA: prolyl oligopeptidase family serine peptidase [Microbacteriaceae bacterium]|nr:prolyl oligopeptidase family serine peptidase [Microbacteriaceae bacterium]